MDSELSNQNQSEKHQDDEYRIRIAQLKSFQILKTTVNIISCNTNLIYSMILSTIPLFSFMLFFDMKLQKLIILIPKLFQYQSPVTVIYLDSTDGEIQSVSTDDEGRSGYQPGSLPQLLQVCVLWLVLYPLLEMFSMIITVTLAAKLHTGQNQVTAKEALSDGYNGNLKGITVTCICVHLLSSSALLGLFWIVVSSRFFTTDIYYFPYHYELNPVDLVLILLRVAVYSPLFVGLLYKYLDWSALWNTSMAVAALGEETGITAFGMAEYYSKHYKKTGVQLMVVLFGCGSLPRVVCLVAGVCRVDGAVGVVVVVVVVGLFCLGNVVKWVVFVVYFYDCKQQTMEKKNDEEVHRVEHASDAC